MTDLRARILGARDIQSERVTIPEWGDAELEVRGMTGAERAKVLKDSSDEKGEMDVEKFYPTLLIASCYDPATGEKIFQPADRDALAAKSVAAIERLAKVALRLSGLDEGGEKNDSPARTTSTSPSPKSSEE